MSTKLKGNSSVEPENARIIAHAPTHARQTRCPLCVRISSVLIDRGRRSASPSLMTGRSTFPHARNEFDNRVYLLTLVDKTFFDQTHAFVEGLESFLVIASMVVMFFLFLAFSAILRKEYSKCAYNRNLNEVAPLL
jgi:hypothetical protein